MTVCVASRCSPSLIFAFPTVILCAFIAAVVGVTVVLCCGLCASVPTGIAIFGANTTNTLYTNHLTLTDYEL